MYEDVAFGTLVSCDMSGHDKSSDPMPHEISSLGMVLKKEFDGGQWSFEVVFVHPFSVIGLVSRISEGAIVWGHTENASEEEIRRKLQSPRLTAREIRAIICLIAIFRDKYAAPTPRPDDWVVHNGALWKAKASCLDKRLVLQSLTPPYEKSVPASGIEVPKTATQKAISRLVEEKEEIERKHNELYAELLRRRRVEVPMV